MGPTTVPPPAVYVPYAQAPREAYEGRAMTFVVRARGNPSVLAAPSRAGVASVDPSLPLANLRPMAEVVSIAMGQPRFTTVVMTFFAGVAFFLAGLGLQASRRRDSRKTSHNTNQRGAPCQLQSHIAMIAKLADIKTLVARGRIEPETVLPELRKLAASDQWQTREVAATALVEIGKRHPAEVLREARRWAKARDANVRRAASEGLRGIVKLDPQAVRPVLETLRADPELYVKKSVANVLRNASARHPDFVLDVCRRWARSRNPHTRWIVKDGLRKLNGLRPREVAAILDSGEGSA